ncbi:TIR domain-containing protein [Nocardia sp. CA-128927]|uniref:TIR domain-containing protein n=1 Tax=Nocardia sp. CA-128927 TaxID=3239975 RepID=UPI003D974BBC
MPVWDVFLSYSRSDAEPALRVGHALRDAGLRVFWDDVGVEPFQPISETILRELGRAKVVLAYYSRDYPHRRACQHELTAAFLAGQHEGDPRRRVLIINPETNTDHIHPIELRDARHASLPEDETEYRTLAAAVAVHTAQIPTVIDAVRQSATTHWLPAPARHSSSRFAGRLPQLWQLHSALHHHRAPLTGQHGGQVAVVHGMVGSGKSRLVLEYAHHFRAAFPGGICWLTADASDPLQTLHRQRALIAQAMQGSPSSTNNAAQDIAQLQRDPFLWVLDNIPPGLRLDDLRELFGPHIAAHTVLTSTDRRYARLGTTIEVGQLPSQDATTLLPPNWSDSDPGTIAQVIEKVDGHAEALTIIARLSSTDAALTELHCGPTALADLADRLLRDLDRDHRVEPAITRDVLRIIAVLEPAPITTDHLATVIGRLHNLDAFTARRTLDTVADILDNLALLRPRTDQTLSVSSLTGHIVRAFDPDTQRTAQIRSLTLGTLAPPPSRPPMHHKHVRTSLLRGCWSLQVELAHRISVLNQPDHGLREALTVLYSFVDFIRSVLTDSGPAPETRPLQEICTALLAQHLRPILTHWHPELLNHELTRQPHINSDTHERNWTRARELRADLAALRESLATHLHHLSSITGSPTRAISESSAKPHHLTGPAIPRAGTRPTGNASPPVDD